MDKMDRDILKLLQENARMTISELSKELSLSRPSMSERLLRLQEKGIIENFTTRVSLKKIGKDILLLIQVSGLKVPVAEFEEMVRQEHDIIECHRVTGEVSYFIKAAVSDVGSMRKLIDRLIPYGTINTSTVLNSPVPYRIILPDEEGYE
ncbi:Lrp/AsnC family transcriptional regulator [Shouchella clausii]|jgi:Lrp/AsnC family transcriptional regulator, leucine-responsive regulatory protein|uniref:AsnC family transcriptional regulator n=1 Tax=Shouchella clausii TaxID=79880 RepID=A0A268S2N8_SHOCL|nr:Lrp/AsnC family transcriptional regulator [Shouchella clausii]PAD42564.1 AsnC family transcriptional regulator [Bacillus sp. 7520-S]SPU21915.1 Lpr/AsnC family transcriptional regulator [Niallia circulans]AST97015.1 AsnC family transcriptional regulator [Shouchella clausii]MBU8594554.1 Lrp/AsnC family transcriptional regulator [Shouchella clausii]MCM3547486.1 Lrp/AsnC family transcriptional regulator [Shouchella clausii]